MGLFLASRKNLVLLFGIPIFLFVIGLSTGALHLIHWFKTPFDNNGKLQLIEIANGTSLNKISAILEKKGIINNWLYYSLIGRIISTTNKHKAGEYHLSPSMSPSHIMKIISNGKVYLHSVTIPEGYNMYEIAELLEKSGMADKARFIKLVTDREFISSFSFISGDNLEGYLFPSTYRFRKGEDEIVIARKMVETFKSMVYDDMIEKAASVNLTPKEVVIMGSVVEKETGQEDEKRIISSVFHNRLKKNMRLQSDPTVIYAIKDFDGNIRKKDLSIDSPYNTYRYPGLPIGPITNPGKTSILAVLNPLETNYLYFVATKDKDGRHYFSTTIKEHNRAVRKYQLGK